MNWLKILIFLTRSPIFWGHACLFYIYTSYFLYGIAPERFKRLAVRLLLYREVTGN